MYKACGLVCKVEDFKPASNNFRSEFIGKDQSGRKQYRGISFKKTQFGSIEDINYYPLMKEFIEIAGKSELLKTVKDYCREHCAWLKTENDIENHAIDCLLSKAYEYWKDFPKQMPEPDKWIFYFKSIKMLERNLGAGMITLFLVPAVFATIVRTICIVQTKWREKQRYFAMFARNVDTMMGT